LRFTSVRLVTARLARFTSRALALALARFTSLALGLALTLGLFTLALTTVFGTLALGFGFRALVALIGSLAAASLRAAAAALVTVAGGHHALLEKRRDFRAAVDVNIRFLHVARFHWAHLFVVIIIAAFE